MENKTNKEYYVEQQLAKTLIELLNVTSLDEISIRSLCEKAGVGRASFYRHFHNKEEILESHAQFLIQQWVKN